MESSVAGTAWLHRILDEMEQSMVEYVTWNPNIVIVLEGIANEACSINRRNIRFNGCV